MLQPFLTYGAKKYYEVEWMQPCRMIAYYGIYDSETCLVPDGCVELFYRILEENVSWETVYKKERIRIDGDKTKLCGLRFQSGYTARCTEKMLEKTGKALIRISDAQEGCLYLLKEILPYVEPISPHPAFLEMLNMLCRTDGGMSVEKLAKQYGYTSRHVYNMFYDAFGAGAKDFCRCIRFQRALREILDNPERNNSYYMERLSYSDQAHFQREFKQFTGMTPKQFIKKTLQ